MKEIRYYRANDGTHFINKENCEHYEKNVTNVIERLEDTIFSDKFMFEGEDYDWLMFYKHDIENVKQMLVTVAQIGNLFTNDNDATLIDCTQAISKIEDKDIDPKKLRLQIILDLKKLMSNVYYKDEKIQSFISIEAIMQRIYNTCFETGYEYPDITFVGHHEEFLKWVEDEKEYRKNNGTYRGNENG